jgi:hypothetical protein
VLAGKPAGELRLGSFEDWAFTIGGMLQFAGVEGFLENRDVLYNERDSQGNEWSAFFSMWRETFGGEFVLLRDVIKTIEQDEDFKETLPMSVFQGLKKYDDTTQKSKTLGRILTGIIERRYGDLYLRQDKKEHAKEHPDTHTNKSAKWAVWSDSEPNDETRYSIVTRKVQEHLRRKEPGQ